MRGPHPPSSPSSPPGIPGPRGELPARLPRARGPGAGKRWDGGVRISHDRAPSPNKKESLFFAFIVNIFTLRFRNIQANILLVSCQRCPMTRTLIRFDQI